jgi:hypothetical protein
MPTRNPNEVEDRKFEKDQDIIHRKTFALKHYSE